MGRKFQQEKIDKDKLEKLMQYLPSSIEAAHFFGVSRETLHRFVKEQYEMEYMKFKDYYASPAKLQLKQVAMTKARNGDRDMLRFCLVNVCGWSWEAKNKQFDEDERIDDIEFVDG